MSDLINIDVKSRIFVWANSDMDGAASVILFRTIFSKFNYRSVFFGAFEEQYKKWAKDNLEDYDKVFVVGMVLSQKLLDEIDDPRVVVISDMGEEYEMDDGLLIDEKCTSCCKLIFKKFRKHGKFTKNIIRLIGYVNDYNDYQLKYPESMYLNGLWRKTSYGRFDKFVDRFKDGYDGLTDSEMQRARDFMKEIETEMENIDLYYGLYKDYRVYAVFSKLSVNEVAHHLMKKCNCEVVIVVNQDTNFVSFRKPRESEANIARMAKKLCDGGGGEFAAGGSITKEFIEFTQNLKKI